MSEPPSWSDAEPARRRSRTGDLRMAEAFANHAAIALELSDRREGQRQLEVLEDRHRIARDLHDHVIQRLFATGLSVQAAAVRSADPDVASRLQTAVEDMDDTIRQIRTSIFGLQDHHTLEHHSTVVLLTVVADVEPALGFTPDLTFTGPVDTVLDGWRTRRRPGRPSRGTDQHREAHRCHRVNASVSASARHIAIEIIDNGSTAPPAVRAPQRTGEPAATGNAPRRRPDPQPTARTALPCAGPPLCGTEPAPATCRRPRRIWSDNAGRGLSSRTASARRGDDRTVSAGSARSATPRQVESRFRVRRPAVLCWSSGRE